MLREPHKIKRLARFVAGLNLESGVYAMPGAAPVQGE